MSRKYDDEIRKTIKNIFNWFSVGRLTRDELSNIINIQTTTIAYTNCWSGCGVGLANGVTHNISL